MLVGRTSPEEGIEVDTGTTIIEVAMLKKGEQMLKAALLRAVLDLKADTEEDTASEAAITKEANTSQEGSTEAEEAETEKVAIEEATTILAVAMTMDQAFTRVSQKSDPAQPLASKRMRAK